MKIDRRNPKHWLYLFAFAVNVLLALVLRPFMRGQGKHVVLYGHKLNGNLLAIHKELCKRSHVAADAVYLSLDPDYARALRSEGVNVVCAVDPRAAIVLARTAVIITDHGLHVMEPLLWLTRIRFVDVWHGIPFKGFDAADFRVQHHYDEVWVASPLMAEYYTQKYGFDPSRVVVTGYARTDRLVKRDEDVSGIRKCLGIPLEGPVILFAPTWVQDDRGRSLYPFGLSETEFLRTLSHIAELHGATVLMRAHLNSGEQGAGVWPRIVFVPQSRFPDTEAVLLASDVLICDWSSIAFDFLVLDRPALFLDVAAPFRKGYSLGPEYRFGPVLSSLEDLKHCVDDCLENPKFYWLEHEAAHHAKRQTIYGGFDDGCSAERCVKRLGEMLPKDGSSR
ncbi:CDP-glycerol glycerophosphotransferase family protein [Pseudazoarcus pumilus]|uniref:CDP-glycerol--glycerophosphate glycerophosphotransferase n=1 Tax=Pseudazoarcus pumilus TaxID=2067960 RepID=A0A2I6S3P9_9RHOO|nr:CDP-glycerol glycerophosphotransferase family protein [Pseudazoarcus pumilus]AUN93894.1 CDP-glycerol--glycerophosphate glycerophosphotransferase [Pseudazoarcus pumilus]